jgi:hypothetical protein
MQLLANENFPLDVVEAIRKIGHDLAWIRTDGGLIIAHAAGVLLGLILALLSAVGSGPSLSG